MTNTQVTQPPTPSTPPPPPTDQVVHSQTAQPSFTHVILLGVAIAVGLGALVFTVLYAPAAWRAIQSAAVSVSAQFFPAQSEESPANTSSATPTQEVPEKLVVSVSQPLVKAGEPFTLSWRYTPSGNGFYTVSFPCRDGVAVYLPDQLGVYREAPCGTPLRVGNATLSTLRLIVVSDGRATYQDVPFTVAFVEEGASAPAAEGSAIVTVERRTAALRVDHTLTPPISDASQAPSAPSRSSTRRTSQRTETSAATSSSQTRRDTQSSAATSNATTSQRAGSPKTSRYPLPKATSTPSTGPANLTVRQLAVGYIDVATNTFIATTSPLTPDKRIAVKFEVKNTGGSRTPRWLFAAVLPTMPPYIFRSALQQELNPGDRIEFVLAFDKVRTDRGDRVEVRINVDPENKVRESDESDNMISIFVPLKR